MNSNTLLGLLAGLAAALIGAGWQLASRYGVTTTLGPMELAALRYLVPALVLMPLLWRTGLLPPGVARRDLLLLVLGGGLPFGLLVLAGAQFAPAAHISVFMSGSMPVFTALLCLVVLGEKLPGWRWAGLTLVAAGVVALASTGSAMAALGHWRGDLLFLLAAVLWAVHTLAFRRCGLTPWHAAALVNAWSALLLLPVLAITGAPQLLTAPWQDVALQALWQGGIAGLLGLVTYLAAVARLGASRAALSAAAVPPLTAVGGVLVLGEALDGRVIAVVMLVAVGLVLASGAVCRPRQGNRGRASPGGRS